MVSLHEVVVKIAGCERMDTQGSFKRSSVFFTIVGGFGFPVISRRSMIRSDSDTSGNIFKNVSEEERRRSEQENNTYFKIPGG